MNSTPITPTPADIYLQRHSALLVTNSRLRGAVLALTVVIVALGYGYMSLARAYSQYKPLVIRINDVGHAEAVTYQAAEYKVQEAEIKYFLMDFMSRHYGRIRGAAQDDLTRSLYYLTPRLADQKLAELRQTRSLDEFLSGIGDQIEVSVDQISIEDLRQQPYKATVTYTKSYYSQLDHVLRRQEKFTGHVQFIVLDRVPHNLIPINPLGLTITYIREDQAFTDETPTRKSAPYSSAPAATTPSMNTNLPHTEPAFVTPNLNPQHRPSPLR